MPQRIEIGTDIAAIGVWDPAHERHDLGRAKHAVFLSELETEAHAARLFFINTFADGGYLTDIYVDDSPDSDHLALYSTVEREFLIESRSGQLIAGGIEDFIDSHKKITSDDHRFNVSPGFYALRLHEFEEEKYLARLRDHIGADDYDYYQNKSEGTPWGCLLFVVSIIFLIAKMKMMFVGALVIWGIYVMIRFRLRAADSRLRDISIRVKEFEVQFPSLIYILRRVSGASGIKGGWHELK